MKRSQDVTCQCEEQVGWVVEDTMRKETTVRGREVEASAERERERESKLSQSHLIQSVISHMKAGLKHTYFILPTVP